MGKFDMKSFNSEAFNYAVENPRIPNLKRNTLIKNGILMGSAEIAALFQNQSGSVYGTIPQKGLLDGEAIVYDGENDITATSTKTYDQSMVVVGRAKAWTEKDFSDDISGQDFMRNVADQVAIYKDTLDQKTILKTLEGIYNMSDGSGNKKFIDYHTNDVDYIGSTTLNTTMDLACGDNKEIFKLVFMHSTVATNLENLQLLNYAKYTDSQGIQRDTTLATWNGRVVIIDDGLPTIETPTSYEKTDDETVDEDTTYYTESSGTYTEVTEPKDEDIENYYVMKEGTKKYVTYVLGAGCIRYVDIGAEVPYEMHREPATNGGMTTLYMRQRKVFSPIGISFTKASMATNSPTDKELTLGDNWSLMYSLTAAGKRSFINHRAIPIARIISKG